MTEKAAERLIPFQVKTRPDIRAKLKKIAKANGLSLNDVAGMAIAAGVNMVESKLGELHQPEPAKAA